MPIIYDLKKDLRYKEDKVEGKVEGKKEGEMNKPAGIPCQAVQKRFSEKRQDTFILFLNILLRLNIPR